MKGKRILAAELKCGYQRFRRELRALEKKDPSFFTGRNQTVTPTQEQQIKAHFDKL